MNRNGFTAIELLVVIVVIGILAVMTMLSLADARARARDAYRKSDLATIKNVLEVYYSDQKPSKYVVVDRQETINGTTDELSTALLNGYAKKIPVDPKDVAPHVYTYQSFHDGSEFKLTATLENNKDPEGHGSQPQGYALTNN